MTEQYVNAWALQKAEALYNWLPGVANKINELAKKNGLAKNDPEILTARLSSGNAMIESYKDLIAEQQEKFIKNYPNLKVEHTDTYDVEQEIRGVLDPIRSMFTERLYQIRAVDPSFNIDFALFDFENDGICTFGERGKKLLEVLFTYKSVSKLVQCSDELIKVLNTCAQEARKQKIPFRDPLDLIKSLVWLDGNSLIVNPKLYSLKVK
ncbi:MAG: hypothetical protein JXB00_06135 [Bacteroidales bacterium]|nr:hypothetical protein [Bacteroidales bacterium]